MAKSVYQKKKRIAHFQNAIDNFPEGEHLYDYVSSIIQNMDDNFNSVNSNSGQHIKSNINGEKDNCSNNTPSTSNNSQNEKNSSKSKKLCVSRKYPLMEKTQKILKQLKHNRRIPKPRAHLGTFPKSPMEVDCKEPTVQKRKRKEGRKLMNNASLYNAYVSDNTILKSSHVNDDSKINNCKTLGNLSKVEKHEKAENETLKKATSVNINVKKNSLCHTDTVINSENDTTDSEYERFVRRNKKGLQKKVLKKQKNSVAKRKASTKISRSTVQPIHEQHDSDSSGGDNILASLASNYKKTKRVKVVHDIPIETDTRNIGNEESEPELTADDVYTRDSSSESDVADNETSITNKIQSFDEENVCSVLYKTNSLSDLSNISDTTLPDITACINKENVSQTCHLIDNNVVQSNNNSPDTFSFLIHSSDSGKTVPSHLSPNLVIDLCNSEDECNNVISDGLSTVSMPKEGKHIITNVGIDLCGSEDECKNVISDGLPTVSIPKEEKHIITNVAIDLCGSEDECKNVISDGLPTVSIPKEGKHIITNVAIDLCGSEGECKNVISDGHPTISITKEEKHMVTDVAIDLCDSDDDYKNAKTNDFLTVLPKKEKCIIIDARQNVINPDSEESDLEIIEITPPQPRISECIISKASSMYDKECQRVESNVESKNMQSVIKTEEKVNVHITSTSHSENQNKKKSDDGKYDAVYMTNICNDLNKDELVLPGNSSNISSVQDKKVKTEVPDDFGDLLKGVRCSTSNIFKTNIMHHNYQHQKGSDLPMDFYTTVKNECSLENLSSLDKKYSMDCVSSKIENTPFSENKLKSFEILCSNSKTYPKDLHSGIYEGKQQFQELERMNMAHLLELYKKEFQNYQEIVQTEANVEASLKLLETRQAEKLKYIRSLVQKYVGNNQNFSETFHSSMKEKEYSNDILSKSQALSTLKTLTNKPSVFTLIDLSEDTESSANQNAQIEDSDLKNCKFSEVPSTSLFPQTAVLSSSKVHKDIKPDICLLDELQPVQQLPYSVVSSKHETEYPLKDQNSAVYLSKFQSGEKQTLKLLKEKCNVCGKEAMAACQRCAKVFFCSHECGKKFWNDGHENKCGK